jgi:hypothetical protein
MVELALDKRDRGRKVCQDILVFTIIEVNLHVNECLDVALPHQPQLPR